MTFSKELFMRPMTATIVMCSLILFGCSKKEDDSTTTTTTGTTAKAAASAAAAATTAAAATQAPAPTAPAAAGGVEASPDMKAFMAMLDGKDDSAGKALKKYGVKGLKDNDLGMYTLQDAKVTKSEKVGALQCYTMLSNAGVMKHTSRLCWNAAGKIAEVTDKSE
jgi:nucleoid-associated protein YgaU